MKYYLIAGERSGDLHASNLVKGLKRNDSQANFRGIGGHFLVEQGLELFRNYKDISFMGFVEVLLNLIKIRQYMQATKADILQYKPDVIILVDFAGFNLRVAKFAKENGIKVYYYISPKIWAWNTGRAEKIKKLVDRMFVILPFEEAFYKQFDYRVDFVGNPVLDAVDSFKKNDAFLTKHGLGDKPIIAVLPGSRKQEIESMLHYMLSITPIFHEYQFVIGGVNNLEESYYQQFTRNGLIKFVIDETYDLLSHSKAAMVTSGTATLETALFNVPQLVGYKTSIISYLIARSVIKVPYISLVNLILNKEVVKELLQDKFHPNYISEEMMSLLKDPERRARIFSDYKEMREVLGGSGASDRAASLMHSYLTQDIATSSS